MEMVLGGLQQRTDYDDRQLGMNDKGQINNQRTLLCHVTLGYNLPGSQQADECAIRNR